MAGIDPKNTNVVLLAGGKSGEREISLASGAGAKAALEEAGFTVTMLDPAEKSDLIKLVQGDFDVAFICLHGRFGEDGTIQGMLEILDIPYIGSGVWSSALAIDKPNAKIFYEYVGIPTPVSRTLYRGTPYSTLALIEHVGMPCVVKPACEGSALGVYICPDLAAVEVALKQAFLHDDEVLVETYVDGDEYTVSVIGNNDPHALPIIQIVPQNEFYDYESKYAPGGSEHICPAPLSPELQAQAEGLAIAAHKALSCKGVSRTDMILDKNGKFWVLETNTVPGMTETSLLPDAARVGGLSFPELCTKLIEHALEQ